MPIIHLQTLIRSTPEICFDLSASIDLHTMSTARTEEKAIAGVTSGIIKNGESVTWEARHFGIRQKLTTKLTAYNRPHHFRDEQVKGAFKSFTHDHLFTLENGQVVMTDVFEFHSPWGILGKVFNRFVLTNYMRVFLTERNEMIKKYAENGDWKKVLPFAEKYG